MPDIRGLVTEWLSAVVDAINAISVTINPGDVQIGAVELKDFDTEIRQKITKSENIMVADDVVRTYTYLDAGANDERLSTVVFASATVHAGETVTETYVWAGIAGAYYLATITRALA